MEARMQILVIRHNSDGRPCGWGLATIGEGETPLAARKRAQDEAERQYDSHCCYPGEEKGRITAKWFDPDEEER